MSARRGFLLALAPACAMAVAAAAPAATAARPGISTGDRPSHHSGDRAPAPAVAASVGGCAVLPADNYWNTPVTGLPVHPRSDQWLEHMSPDSRLHPDFGPSYGEQPVPYGIPVTIVDAEHPLVPVQFQYSSESDPGPYPLGADTLIEGGAGAGGDRHAVIVNKDDCRLYETFATRFDGSWFAGSGAVWDLTSNALRPRGWTSADAAGLPILPGLLRVREVEQLHLVDHAIRFTTDVTDRRHVWPARHDAGSVSDASYPPMGARFRLSARFPMAGYRPDTRAVLKAMKTYGLVLADNGSPWFFQGESRSGWQSAMLDELKTVPASAFVAVKTASLMVDPDSGQTG